MMGISEGVGDMIADSEIGMHMRLDRFGDRSSIEMRSMNLDVNGFPHDYRQLAIDLNV